MVSELGGLSEQQDSFLQRAGQWLTPAVFTLMVAFQVHIVNTLHDLDKRLAVREANQFTMQDWTVRSEALIQKLPPRWVHDAISELKEKQGTTRGDVSALEAQIQVVRRDLDRLLAELEARSRGQAP